MIMPESAISEQKRLVRGEFWLAARKKLRARDKQWHCAWRVLIIAGPAPAEEINCIRTCMHNAHITAVDIEEANVLAAIDAGADDAYVCDIGRTEIVHNPTGNYSKTLPAQELVDKKFDVIALDLTGPANDWLKDVIACYFRQSLTTKGIMTVTFCYGRDVREAIMQEWEILQSKASDMRAGYRGQEPYPNNPGHHYSFNILKEIPEQIAMRVWCALRTRCTDLEFCIQYRGSHMPMVTCLVAKNRPVMGVEFKALAPEDLEFALVNEELNLSKLYATPVERVEAFRAAYKHKLAAYKAVETRRLRETKQPQLRLVASEGTDVAVPPPTRLKQIEKLWHDCTPDERAAVWDILHQLYRERKDLKLADPDVRARAALMREVNEDRELPGAS